MSNCLMLRTVALSALFASTAVAQTAPPTVPPIARFNTCPKPEWPRESLRRSETGTVTLKFLIDEQGKVIDAIVRKSSGHEALDQAALKGISRCQFTPSLRDGQPRRSWAPVQYVWTLAEKQTNQAVDEANAARAAAEKGDIAALYKLAVMLQGSSGVKADPAASAQVLRMAADRGHEQAILSLANYLEYGNRGFPKDPAQARTLYLKGAQLGFAEAQYKTGMFLLQGTAGAAKDTLHGAGWLLKAADQGNAMAAFELALIAASGADVPQDLPEAARLLRLAAEKDIVRAQYRLAVALLSGSGVAPDPVEAARWLAAAAEDRHVEAELLLAELKLEGKVMERDEAGGMSLLRRSAYGGNGAAMAILGTLLTRGVHTAADTEEGGKWSAKAAQYLPHDRFYSNGYFAQIAANN